MVDWRAFVGIRWRTELRWRRRTVLRWWRRTVVRWGRRRVRRRTERWLRILAKWKAHPRCPQRSNGEGALRRGRRRHQAADRYQLRRLRRYPRRSDRNQRPRTRSRIHFPSHRPPSPREHQARPLPDAHSRPEVLRPDCRWRSRFDGVRSNRFRKDWRIPLPHPLRLLHPRTPTDSPSRRRRRIQPKPKGVPDRSHPRPDSRTRFPNPRRSPKVRLPIMGPTRRRLRRSGRLIPTASDGPRMRSSFGHPWTTRRSHRAWTNLPRQHPIPRPR